MARSDVLGKKGKRSIRVSQLKGDKLLGVFKEIHLSR